MDIAPVTLKAGLILFWAVWLSVVLLTNILAGLKIVGILPGDWKFASGNYKAIVDTVGVYGWPEWGAGGLFAAVILWQGVIVFLFWRAFLSYSGSAETGTVVTAFAVSLALWAAFMLADEIFTAYRQQTTHVQLFIAQLLTLVTITWLP